MSESTCEGERERESRIRARLTQQSPRSRALSIPFFPFRTPTFFSLEISFFFFLPITDQSVEKKSRVTRVAELIESLMEIEILRVPRERESAREPIPGFAWNVLGFGRKRERRDKRLLRERRITNEKKKKKKRRSCVTRYAIDRYSRPSQLLCRRRGT